MKHKTIYTIIIALLALAAVTTTATMAGKGVAISECGWLLRSVYILCGIFTFLSAASSIVVTAVMSIIENR